MMKMGMPKASTEMAECTRCGGYVQRGYELRCDTASQFVCEECYEQHYAGEYPLCENMLEISKQVLSQIAPKGKKPSFQAGYLLGKREDVNGIQKLVVTDFYNGLSSDRGTVFFFSREDVINIRKKAKEKGNVVVALYRTSPSGLPDFNELDVKTAQDMVGMIPYLVIGGNSEIQISARDRHYPQREYGVTIV